MEEAGLWRLFFATGLPEVYLAVRGTQQAKQEVFERPAKTAFQGRWGPAGQA
jgi:hypothetical protein